MKTADHQPTFIAEILESILPSRTKRLLLIGSLCGKLVNKLKIDAEYLSLLNTQFSLCREEQALKFPLAVSDYIWREIPLEVTTETTAGDDQMQALACKLLEGVPDWLRYDRDSYIMDDLFHLLKFNNIFIKNHQRMLPH